MPLLLQSSVEQCLLVVLETLLVHSSVYFHLVQFRISYLPQEPSVFKKFTVEENIWSVLETRKDLTNKQKKQRLDDLIEEFSIGRIRHQKAYTLSGGERRRTEIARSLAMKPKAILFDEPTSALDPEMIGEVLAVMKELANEGMTMLIVTHEMNFARDVADRIIFMDGGVILADQPKEEFFANQQNERIRNFLSKVE